MISQPALIVRDQRTRLGGHVLCGLIAGLALVAALDQVAEADIPFGIILQVIWSGHAVIQVWILLGRGAERQIFPVRKQRRIRAEIGCDFQIQALVDRGTRSDHVVIVLERHLNGLVQRDPDGAARSLGECR